ncbi:hypothetical protein EIP91_007742 [Steccherinum ochraceum]|uniref:Uncharacterized protein n=1 Tax=Steccherinum ochraceum TaxID=92696 RepID=A0A4R0RST3_9APHY|nr:hypothetical protein EIP91_007742 [Steccherinum ochraceum]
MPARPRTPSPGPDEPRYLTVVSPYPLHANMELLGDLKQCVYWLATCMDSDPLLAVFHKPSAPNMIIIEVDRSFNDWDSLLGEHKWIDFLRSPSQEDKDKVSQIFYCTFSTGRQVQKHGWLRKDVQSEWFDVWKRNNKIVKYPYPKSSYCATPPEDKTNAPLCRPLPVKSFPPPPPVRLPPVGSPEWLKLKEAEGKTPSMAAKGAWGKGAPGRASAPGSSKAGHAKGVPTLASGAARPNAPARSISSPAGPVLPPGINSPVPLVIPTASARSGQAPSSTSPLSAGAEGDWPGVPPALTRGSSAASGSSSSSSDSGQATPAAHDGGAIAHAMATLSFDDDLWEAGQNDGEMLNRTRVFQDFDGPEAPVEVVEATPAEPQLEWAGYVFKDDEDSLNKEPEIECTIHGKLCKKGICKQYKAQKREKERAKEASDRRAAMEKKAAEREKKKRDGGVKPKYNMLPARSTPAHFVPPTSTIAEGAWGRAPAGAASSSVSPNPISPSADGGAPAARPAKGRRMNIVAAPLMEPVPFVPKTAGPTSDGASTTGGWGNPSNGPWGPSAGGPSTNAVHKKAPSSVSSGGWGKISNGPWGPPPGAGTRGKGPSSVSSNGWGHVSNGPWGPGSNNGGGGGAEGKKKGPSSVASTASSGWGNVSNGPWGSRAPSVHGYTDEEDDDDARTVDGGDAEEEEERGRAGAEVWASDDAPKGANKSWADQVEEEDGKSVISSNGGWGKVSNGPWK